MCSKIQRSRGIRLWPEKFYEETQCKIIAFVDYNLWLQRLDTQLNKPTNQIKKKVKEQENVIVKLWGLA